ncbi:MAG: class I adenylate-forming enzyme family protein [Lysobacterales bacterium]
MDPLISFEHLAAGLAEDHEVVIEHSGRCVTRKGLDAEASLLANKIAALGLPSTQRIGVLLPNSADSVASVMAVARSGHCCLPLSPGLTPDELSETVERCAVGAILCRAEKASDLPAGMAVIRVDEVPLRSPETVKTVGQKLDARRAFVCLSTSGSTGRPKLAERSARAVLANARRVATALGVTSADRFVAVVPFWHANGFSNCLLMPLLAGASIVTMDRFLPRPFLDALVEHRVTVVIGSPFIYRSLLRVLDVGYDLSRVRAWISSGALLPAELDAELRERGIRVRQLYGSSETGTLCISGEQQKPPGTVGAPLPGVGIRLLQPDGSRCAEGEEGEVRVRSDAMFSAYVGSTDAVFAEDGSYKMNDRAVFEKGELRLLGRSDAMINVAGVKVDPEEVRAVIEKMAGVRRALVSGVENAAGGETVKARVVADTELSAGDLLAHCRQQLAEYKLPRIIEFSDHIPEDLMGKSARRLLGD